MNQTMQICKKQFDLQDVLISKQAGVLIELLGKKCAGDYHFPYENCPEDENLREKFVHPIYWESDGLTPLDSAK